LHRKLIENPIFSNAHLFHLYSYCLLKANHKAKEIILNGELVKLEAGQFVTGRNILSESLKQNPNTIYKRLKNLEKLKYLSLKSNNKNTIVTIGNWESYQSENDESNNKKEAVVDLNLDLCKKNQPPPPEKIYQENIGLLTPHIAEKIKSLIGDGVTEELLSKYIQVSVERNIKTWGYIEKMAIGNLEKNIKTLEQYNASEVERQKTKAKQIVTALNIPQHVNFDQREPEDDYEKYYYKVPVEE